MAFIKNSDLCPSGCDLSQMTAPINHITIQDLSTELVELSNEALSQVRGGQVNFTPPDTSVPPGLVPGTPRESLFTPRTPSDFEYKGVNFTPDPKDTVPPGNRQGTMR